MLYEPPVLPPPLSEADDRMAALLADDRRAEVVETFFGEIAGMSAEELDLLRTLPSWPARVAAAHTVVRERNQLDGHRFDPTRFTALSIPTLLLAGGDSPAFLRDFTAAVAAAVPGARVVTLAGQQHIAMDTAPDRFAAEVLGFLKDGDR